MGTDNSMPLLEMPNEKLGELVKHCAKYIDSKVIEGYNGVVGLSAILSIISSMRLANAATLELMLEDVSSEMFPDLKNYRVTIEVIK